MGGSTAPRCSAIQTRSHRERAPAAGRKRRSKSEARLGSSVPLIASSGIARIPLWRPAGAAEARSS
jgi:hypothetical protein